MQKVISDSPPLVDERLLEKPFDATPHLLLFYSHRSRHIVSITPLLLLSARFSNWFPSLCDVIVGSIYQRN